MVVERDRSYMVATTTDGTVSRISPFGKGDTRLQANQRIERVCEVKDSSIKTERRNPSNSYTGRSCTYRDTFEFIRT